MKNFQSGTHINQGYYKSLEKTNKKGQMSS